MALEDKSLDNVISMLAQKFEVPRDQVLLTVHQYSQELLQNIENFVLVPTVVSKTLIKHPDEKLPLEDRYRLYIDLIGSNLATQVLADKAKLLNQVINIALTELCTKEDLFQDDTTK
tara:strand:- start:161 stop:511 length:351 start_codon:yes stop_codon:yes gene_type:complete